MTGRVLIVGMVAWAAVAFGALILLYVVGWVGAQVGGWLARRDTLYGGTAWRGKRR